MSDKKSTEKIHRLLADIPCFSTVALKAQEALSQPDLNIDELVKVLETDPSLVGKILRIANSSFYGLERQIASLRDASIVLGQKRLQNLILTAAVMDILHSQSVDKIRYQELMTHFIHTGLLARDMASRVGVNGDTAYITGLLHDIGSMFIEIMLPNEAELIRKNMDEYSNHEKSEKEILGFDHAEFSGEIARHWKLPEEISIPMLHHHNIGSQQSDMNVLIFVADKLSTILVESCDSINPVDVIGEAMLERLSFTEDSIFDYMQVCTRPDDVDVNELLG